jgi:DNA-directed RNA polymerase delta subunit
MSYSNNKYKQSVTVIIIENQLIVFWTLSIILDKIQKYKNHSVSEEGSWFSTLYTTFRTF